MTRQYWQTGGGEAYQDYMYGTWAFNAYNQDGSLNSHRDGGQWFPTEKGWKINTVHPGRTNIKGIGWRNPGQYSRWGVKYSYTPTTESIGPMWWWYNQTYVTSGLDNAGYNPNDWSFPVPDTSDLRNQVIAECLNKLADKKVDIGQYLAEVHKSAEMVKDAAIPLLRTLKDVRHGRIPSGSALGFARGVNNASLQWRYGWRPLISDLYGMYKQLQNGAQTRPLIFSAERTISRNKSGTWNAVSGKPGTYEGTMHVKAKVYASPNDQFVASLNQWGLANPLALAWELVPYSFVLDWFLPLGSYLSALSASAGLNLISGFTTEFWKGYYKTPLLNAGKCDAEYFTMTRTPWSGWPSAWSGFKPYAVDNPLNSVKTGLIVQLISQCKL